MMKGIRVEHFDGLCLNKTHNRNGHERLGSICCADSRTAVDDLQLGNIKTALPCLNDSCIHRKKDGEIKENNGKRKKKETDGRVYFFGKRLLMELVFLNVCSESKDPWRPSTVPTYYVQLNLKKEDKSLLKNYLYMWTFAF